MNSPLARTAKHAIVGSVVGEVVSVASNFVAGQLTMKASSNSSSYYLVNGVMQGVVTAGLILAGDRLINSMMRDDDPLYRMFYYQVAFHHSPAYGIANATRTFINSLMNKQMQYGPGPVTQKDEHSRYAPGPMIQKKCGDCTATGKSCSGCGGH